MRRAAVAAFLIVLSGVAAGAAFWPSPNDEPLCRPFMFRGPPSDHTPSPMEGDGFHWRIDLETPPALARVRLCSADGEITVDRSLEGPLTLQIDSAGVVDVDRVGLLVQTAQDENGTLELLVYQTAARTRPGIFAWEGSPIDIRLSIPPSVRLGGVSALTRTGDIVFRDLDFRQPAADSYEGNVALLNVGASDSLFATSRSGDVTVALAPGPALVPERHVNVRSTQGDLFITLPLEDDGLQLYAFTEDGKVDVPADGLAVYAHENHFFGGGYFSAATPGHRYKDAGWYVSLSSEEGDIKVRFFDPR